MKKKIINALVGYTGFIGSNLKHIKKIFNILIVTTFIKLEINHLILFIAQELIQKYG